MHEIPLMNKPHVVVRKLARRGVLSGSIDTPSSVGHLLSININEGLLAHSVTKEISNPPFPI